MIRLCIPVEDDTIDLLGMMIESYCLSKDEVGPDAVPEPLESEDQSEDERPYEDSPQRSGLHFHAPEDEDYTQVWPKADVHIHEVHIPLVLAKSALMLGGVMALIKLLRRKRR